MLQKKKNRSERLKFLKVVTWPCSLAVDEYIAIAKEKHGYNVEQVCREMCVCVCICAHVCARACPHAWACRGRKSVLTCLHQSLPSFFFSFYPQRPGLLVLPGWPSSCRSRAAGVGHSSCFGVDTLKAHFVMYLTVLGIPSRRVGLLLERSTLCKWVSGRSLHGAVLEVSGIDFSRAKQINLSKFFWSFWWSILWF